MGDASTDSRKRLQATEGRRIDLLRQIGSKRHSFVIAYLTSTREGTGRAASVHMNDVAIIETHVQAARRAQARNIDLILVTQGGSAAAPWDLVAMVREHFRDGGFRVIVPSVAYSAGTAIAIGADEIVMGPNSILGPIDAQGAGSASNFQGFLDLIDRQKLWGYRVREKTMDWLTAQTDAAEVGRLYRDWKEDRRVTELTLASRRSKLSPRNRERILRFVLYEIGNHGQSIRRTEARTSGISFITDLEKTGVEQQVSELFKLYEDAMQLRVPLARRSDTIAESRHIGDEVDFDVSGVHSSEVPIAFVESVHDSNPAFVAYGLRHWNHAPPLPNGNDEQQENETTTTPESAQRLDLRNQLTWHSNCQKT